MTHRFDSTTIYGPTGVGQHGFTLVEAVMSMLIVGLMMVAALNTVGASRISQARNAEQGLGPMLAEDLMAEILSQYYEEPVSTVQFGREAGESGSNRSAWDDVDDYDSWSKKPPQNKDGTDMPDLAEWKRKVKVYWVNASNLNQKTSSSTGIKRIDVTVKHQGRVVAELSTLRTVGWPDP